MAAYVSNNVRSSSLGRVAEKIRKQTRVCAFRPKHRWSLCSKFPASTHPAVSFLDTQTCCFRYPEFVSREKTHHERHSQPQPTTTTTRTSATPAHLSSDSTKKDSVSSTPSTSHRGLEDSPHPSQSFARTCVEAVSSPRLRCHPPTPMPYPWHKTTGTLSLVGFVL